MLRNVFNFRLRRSNVEKAQVVARIQRIGFIVLGILVALLFAEIGIGCALVPRRCAPTISVISVGVCIGLLVLLLLVFLNPRERWPVATLAIGITVSVGCLFIVLAVMP
jgi:hypothetical protein